MQPDIMQHHFQLLHITTILLMLQSGSVMNGSNSGGAILIQAGNNNVPMGFAYLDHFLDAGRARAIKKVMNGIERDGSIKKVIRKRYPQCIGTNKERMTDGSHKGLFNAVLCPE